VREVCEGACHVVGRILEISKFVARITFVPLAGTLRKLGANTAGRCVLKRVMEIHHVPVHEQ